MSRNFQQRLQSARSVWAAFAAVALLAGTAVGQLAGSGDGLANRAVGRLAGLNLNGPGYLYYGVNAADRGLGYIGSYMTLGGFVPVAEDDLGGVWNADLRSHLSVNGGFFSNVGAVRKQLLGGGSLLGFGIFWDYDADLDQYPTFGEPAAIFGQFGHVYNQVGVSGELLTDWGNLRSNGYIPVGQTGFQFLNDHTPFIQNYIIAQNGLDAALGGADLELGAYIPALADWAGMINVGGYAFGNANYTQNYGTEAGEALVPWFGGVYTRLDLTFARNWDFSLQYNNDSFFNSTGFARLTYRMGGSRRRNVPDQMEQPMFRNEHIVRAHETPLVALNPQNSNQPWQVVHVDNTAFPGGDGTAEAPFQTLADAQGSALFTSPWTVAYLWAGSSAASGNVAINPYTDSFTFQQPNQFLIGSGGPLSLAITPVAGSGLLTIPALTTTNPVLSNTNAADANGASIVIANGNGGATIANLQTLGSIIGIDASGNLDGTAQPVGTTANPFGTPQATAGGSAIRNAIIAGDGTSAIQRGVRIAAIIDTTGPSPTPTPGTEPTGGIEVSDTRITNTSSVAFQVGAFDSTTTPPVPIPDSGGNANIDYNGTISNSFAENGNFASVLTAILGTTGGTINLAATAPPSGSTVPNEILDIGGQGILIAENNDSATQGDTVINVSNVTLVDPTPTAIAVVNDHAQTTISAVATTAHAYGISKTSGQSTIAIVGGGPLFAFSGTINNQTSPTNFGNIIGIQNVTNANIDISGPGLGPLLSTANGVEITNASNSQIAITGLDLQGLVPTGIDVSNSANTMFAFADTSITNATGQGVLLDTLSGTTSVAFNGLNVSLGNSGGVGIVYRDSTNSGLVNFSEATITGATTQGVQLSNNTGTTAFNNLAINLTSNTARGFEAIDAGTVYATGDNTIANASTTLAAIFIDGTTTLVGPNSEGLDLLSVVSGNTAQSGQLLTLTLDAANPGAGYALSSTVDVDVDSPSTLGGITATAQATTNATGAVTAIAAVTSPGSGYAVGDTVTLPPSDTTVTVTTPAEAEVATVNSVETAITIGTGPSGAINMGTFTVGGASGTGVNVSNDSGGGVTVRVGGSQISP